MKKNTAKSLKGFEDDNHVFILRMTIKLQTRKETHKKTPDNTKPSFDEYFNFRKNSCRLSISKMGLINSVTIKMERYLKLPLSMTMQINATFVIF
ncbi:MAG: hypothetical protein M3Z01_08915 [Thermoproteota archaeon]|nr:hypothetical protein [Thermoproteota archaeon]